MKMNAFELICVQESIYEYNNVFNYAQNKYVKYVNTFYFQNISQRYTGLFIIKLKLLKRSDCISDI